jgi:hypothetical protein
MKHPRYLENDDRPVLDWESFCSEMLYMYNTHSETIPELRIPREELSNTAREIFEALIYDYAMFKTKKLKPEHLNYRLAEA